MKPSVKNSLDVELWYPCRYNTPEMERIKDVFNYYDVSTAFRLKALPCCDLLILQRFSNRIWAVAQSISFALQALKHIKDINSEEFVLYTRDLWIAIRLAEWKRRDGLRNTVIFEAHTFPEGIRRRWMPKLRYLDHIVVLTKSLQSYFIRAGVPDFKVQIAPDGVDLRLYKNLLDKELARQKLQLPLEKKLVAYTGHLYPWKGVDTLIESAGLLPKVQFLLVGGTKIDQQRVNKLIQKQGLSNVQLAGYKPPSKIPFYLMSADVLMLPNSTYATISREYTSPLKLFEYMAAKRPIVATDLPSIREVLHNGRNAILVEPDNPEALAEGIKRVLDNPELANSIAAQARKDVEDYTWEKRSKKILQLINR